jgi:hypothetical protein
MRNLTQARALVHRALAAAEQSGHIFDFEIRRHHHARLGILAPPSRTKVLQAKGCANSARTVSRLRETLEHSDGADRQLLGGSVAPKRSASS